MNRTITKSQYYELLGLKALADQWEIRMNDIVEAARKITREEDDFGHTADCMYGSRTVKEMLKLLDLEVR